MRIDLNARTPEPPDARRAAKSGSQAASGTSGGETQAGDKADLSLDQERVRTLAAEVNRLPEIRQEKVVALTRAIQEGSYEVTPEQTAEAIVSEMLSRSAA
jgi:flagellar biosynthesis anti-sigma factor FlgM